jgi:hypothetical protein
MTDEEPKPRTSRTESQGREMNKAQKLLQPLIDAAETKYQKTSSSGYGCDREARAEASLYALEEASNALATIADAITLADVPAVEWEIEVVAIGSPFDYEVDKYGGWEIFPQMSAAAEVQSYGLQFEKGQTEYWSTRAKAKRYVEISIHLAAIKRKLLAELAGEK